ncbi:glycerophosphocholine cholinephosphodiesterase ENPP6 isoform X2 [Pseudoliparis swirei]|uniref:glycerophosphocholine cholinephosphodiesterase ENPP6 isoform X2 n=1 Tax=Pseudoliparis swirei TaxID=2059687 RepID=UPI0024BE2488|nr:glycerophosphocholine cholinephosphodiesterase ENPP6 isoform X2 [Pseudoliparis swirei]
MSPRRTTALCLQLLPLLLLLGAGQQCLAGHQLLVFLIDGFRYDYMDDLQALPGLRQLVDNGVKVDYMTPDFPSLSYPNYYSLMTGCEVEILSTRATFCEEYYDYPSAQNFIDSIGNAMNVLSSGEADMAAIYHEKIDVEGHHFGPKSPEVRAAVQELDKALQLLNSIIKEKGMMDKLNIMLFSDHGMTELQWMDKVIELDKHINMSDIAKMMDRGPVVSLWPKDNKYQAVYAMLTQIPNMNAYAKQEIPERFNLRSGKFVSPLTLVADPGWFIIENKAKLPYWKNDSGTPSAWQAGWHGYDNEFLDMRGFFVATGPDFKQNFKAAPIRSVDIYNLMCSTLGVKPLPNNGSWSRVESFLNGSDGPALSTTLCCMGMLGILLALWE